MLNAPMFILRGNGMGYLFRSIKYFILKLPADYQTQANVLYADDIFSTNLMLDNGKDYSRRASNIMFASRDVCMPLS